MPCKKSTYRYTEEHSELCQTFNMELVKLVAAVNYFRKTLFVRSLEEFSIRLNLCKLVSSFEYAWVCLGSEYTAIWLNITNYAKVLNMPQYNWIFLNRHKYAWIMSEYAWNRNLEPGKVINTLWYRDVLRTSSTSNKERFAKTNIVFKLTIFAKRSNMFDRMLNILLNMPGLHKVMEMPKCSLEYCLNMSEYAWKRTSKIALKSLYKLLRAYW